MSDTERLEAAAAKLEQHAEHLETVVRYSSAAGWRTRWTREAAQDRAVAALLRAVGDYITDAGAPYLAAEAVAAAVLGVPASPKGATE